ncbi:MAG: helix-turn-helix domain-containing protein [Microbacteriaceae bacterium]|nr:helix-turn-helix domain-containing protein [Microbacteriaceae bacterium]
MTSLPGTGVATWDTRRHAPRPEREPSPGILSRIPPELMDADYWDALPDPIPVAHLAVIFRVHEQTILNRLADGTIPAHRIGRSWIVFKAELYAFLMKRRGQPLEAEPDPLVGFPEDLDIEDLMALFGKHKQTIRRWLIDQELPGYQELDRSWRCGREALRIRLEQTRPTRTG